MEQLEQQLPEPRHLARVQVTLEPKGQFAVWLTMDGEMNLYGTCDTRLEVTGLCNEIGAALGVGRLLEV